MLIYYIPLFILYILCNLKLGSYEKKIERIIIVLLGLFLCTTYFSGSDWRQYELMYNNANYAGLSSFYAEKGFYMYMLLFKTFGFDFWIFFIITKFFCFYIIGNYILKNTLNKFFSLMLFYIYCGLSLFIDCPFRNLIAISIFIYSEKYLLERKYYRYFILAIFACLFHNSAIIMFFLPLLIKIGKISKGRILICMFLYTIIISNQKLVVSFIEMFPYYLSKRIFIYMNTEYFTQRLFSFGSIEKIIILILYILNRDKFKKTIYNKEDVSLMLIVYYLFYRLSFTIDIFGRTVQYFNIYYILVIDIIRKNIKKLNNRLIFTSILFFYMILVLNKSLTYDYRYIPYTSYFEYIFKEKPSYKFRSEYNFREWEERLKIKDENKK